MGNCKSYQCKQMHVDKDTRIAALEAQLAEAKRFLEMALDYEGDVFGRYHNDVVDLISTKAEPPARTAEQAVMEAMVEAAVQAVRQYTRETLFIDEHRELVRAALKAAMEAGRHD